VQVERWADLTVIADPHAARAAFLRTGVVALALMFSSIQSWLTACPGCLAVRLQKFAA